MSRIEDGTFKSSMYYDYEDVWLDEKLDSFFGQFDKIDNKCPLPKFG